MKRYLVVLAMVVVCSAAHAQNIGGAQVKVEMDASARNAIEAQQIYSVDKVQGYQISIFSDNGQSARTGATEALNEFREHFDGINSEMVYEMPFFKVYIGRFLDRNEAVRMLGIIDKVFPKAIISTHEFELAVFTDIEEEFMVIEEVPEGELPMEGDDESTDVATQSSQEQ